MQRRNDHGKFVAPARSYLYGPRSPPQVAKLDQNFLCLPKNTESGNFNAEASLRGAKQPSRPTFSPMWQYMVGNRDGETAHGSAG
jgi:hypothetical protein